MCQFGASWLIQLIQLPAAVIGQSNSFRTDKIITSSNACKVWFSKRLCRKLTSSVSAPVRTWISSSESRSCPIAPGNERVKMEFSDNMAGKKEWACAYPIDELENMLTPNLLSVLDTTIFHPKWNRFFQSQWCCERTFLSENFVHRSHHNCCVLKRIANRRTYTE